MFRGFFLYLCVDYVNEFFCVDYVNDFDKPVVFQCPNGGVMDGVHSYHDNGAEDRRFRFYCCEKPGYVQKQSFSFHLYQLRLKIEH